MVVAASVPIRFSPSVGVGLGVVVVGGVVGFVGVVGEEATRINNRQIKERELWSSMLTRCYDDKFHSRFQAYVGCSVSENFKFFSYFKEWSNKQIGANALDDKGNPFALDKDILVKGNKMYSETTCIFIPQRINALLTKSNATRGKHPIGVSWKKQSDRYSARCNTDRGVAKHLGYFDTPEEAFCVYKAYKEQLIKDVANNYKDLLDSHAYDALMNYSVDIDD